LYKKCWDFDPQKRPTTKEILTTLDKILEETTSEAFIINRNRRPVPILTRNVPPTLPVVPSTQIYREPSPRSLKPEMISNRSNSHNQDCSKISEDSATLLKVYSRNTITILVRGRY
ncbi:12413_t:CDS:2, partial [Dentiscutata erythropus]